MPGHGFKTKAGILLITILCAGKANEVSAAQSLPMSAFLREHVPHKAMTLSVMMAAGDDGHPPVLHGTLSMKDEGGDLSRLQFPTRFFPEGLIFLRKENRFMIPYIGKTLAAADGVVLRHEEKDFTGVMSRLDENSMDLSFRRVGSDGHVFIGRLARTETCLLHVHAKKVVDAILIQELTEAVVFKCENKPVAH